MKPPLLLAAICIVIYLLAPGPSQSLLGSWPLTPAGLVALVAAVGAAILALSSKRDTLHAGWAAFFGVLIASRVVFGIVDVPAGWQASYYANTEWSGRPEWSSDFRLADATRIDRSLTFSGTQFPTHYLNGAAFVSGVRREFSEPMSVEWSGAFDVRVPTEVLFNGRATGSASIAFDGSAPLALSGPGRHQVGAGRHRVTVKYVKPADTDGEFIFSLTDVTGAAIAVTPPSAPAGIPAARSLSLVADAIAIVILFVVFVLSFGEALRSSQRIEAMVGVGLVTALGVQGLVAAQPLLGTFKTLTGGDDWLGFESRARDILQNGVLMTLGRPLGEGAAYFYHPFYSYVLAATHAVAGESLFGPIVMHFLVLAVTAYVMWSFARDLFGAVAAAWGLAALLVLFEIDFVRYYTVTLLSENVYVLTVTLCLRAFAKWAQVGTTRFLVQAGLWAGVSAVTRPAMMMFLVPALVVAAAVAAWRKTATSPLASAAMVCASWFAVVAPFTIRNWIVARQLVLISDGLGPSFVSLNVPLNVDPAKYLAAGGGIVGGATGLFRLLMDYPLEFASIQVQKIGFTLGMVHWFEPYRPHPELVAITVLYLVMIVLSPTMRSAALWPVHAFVVAHVTSMGLTSPWNYGYRMILPPYVYTTTFSVAAGAAWWRAR
jgi:hypothetical protein